MNRVKSSIAMNRNKTPQSQFKGFQRDIDATPSSAYELFRAAGPQLSETKVEAVHRDFPGLRRYDEALDKVMAEVKATPVAGMPAVWLVYNMGLVVKTPATTFAIDLAHRKGLLMEPILDFALVTHNHDDHVDMGLIKAMDGHGKTVVSNFFGNYGAHRNASATGGYTPARGTFKIGDAKIRATPSDHNGYLRDFTLAFEVTVGGWTLYHTGDSYDIARLNPSRKPDLWVVHPRCGLNVEDGVGKFHPRRVAICHLCELGHPPDRWRWTIADGLADAAKAQAAGAEAIVPVWGERIQ